ncbi:MAG: MAE_28990/MAE_18760 family HEPN-like nuclease [Crocosphaera sp.]
MSKDNQTVSILQQNLDEDFSWRIKELSLLKSKIPRQKGTEQNVLIRAGITLLYAHWEGFIKYSAECYLQFVSLQRLKYNELDYCFIALASRKSISELIKTNKFELQQEMVKNLLDSLEERANIPYSGVINTKSNLNFEVFRDICMIIGIDDRKYETKKNAIDEELLTIRNKIAHGKYLSKDYKEFMEIYQIVITLMRNIKDDILNAAITEKYKRV